MKKRILIISGEAWRDESNGGNVLSNLFETFTDDYEFAQIFTNPAMPSNTICKKYFHISEGEVIKSFLNKANFGYELDYLSIKNDEIIYKKNEKSSTLSYLKKLNFPVFHTIQDVIWRLSSWKTPALEKFILDYNPDIIFAPMYYSLFIHRIDRYVFKLTGKKNISYVSDDHLTFRHFSFSPFFWINRILLRKNVISTSKFYSLLYTMTDEQKNEYENVLKVPMKVLKKSGNFNELPIFKSEVSDPILITYGGNLIYNRYKTLAILASNIKEINKDGIKFKLNIYTQTPITKKLKSLLDDGANTNLKGKVSMQELNLQYQNSDIVLHVESFDLKQKLNTRISFSTKIIDLMYSARCILAICWSESSPYKYLEKEDAAICISDLSGIKEVLLDLYNNKQKISQYSKKAWDCGVRNHNAKDVIKGLKEDFKMFTS